MKEVLCQLSKALQLIGKTSSAELSYDLDLQLCLVKHHSQAIQSYDSQVQRIHAQGLFWDQTICMQPTEQSKACN